MIEYRLIRSDRRTLSISIDREGALVVRAPKRMSIRDIEAFLVQKQRWIAEKQQEAKAAALLPLLEEGAQIPFWGQMLTLAFADIKSAAHRDGVLWLPRSGDAAVHARKWRSRQAQLLITPRVKMWAERTGLVPSGIAYGNAQSRWGSMNCRTHGLRLNAALVHCPPELADYVIVHELVHLLHPDHSPAFHASVRSILPDADERRECLKRCAGMLRLWK